MKKILFTLFLVVLSLNFAGCTFIKRMKRADADRLRVEELSRQLNEFERAQAVLEKRLRSELADKQVRLEMMEKGLVITFLADVLFDSGKADLKENVHTALDKVARVLKKNVPDNAIGIEGHTDNIPIKRSGWKSNWELSTARALSVLHYLVDKRGVSPVKRTISVIGYGEYRPVDSNLTKQGRQRNRRVEIVILPKVTKVKQSEGIEQAQESNK